MTAYASSSLFPCFFPNIVYSVTLITEHSTDEMSCSTGQLIAMKTTRHNQEFCQYIHSFWGVKYNVYLQLDKAFLLPKSYSERQCKNVLTKFCTHLYQGSGLIRPSHATLLPIVLLSRQGKWLEFPMGKVQL